MTHDLHRTNINLYFEDVEFLRQRYGTGWTTIVRDIVRKHIKDTTAKIAEINAAKTEALIKEQTK